MNVYIESPRWPSLAITRITDNLRANLPRDVYLGYGYEQADLIIYCATGRRDHLLAKTQAIKKQGKKYAIIQLSLKSTRNPDPADWLEIWQGAQVVWSYYDLPGSFNFYHAPLGADPAIFYPLPLARKFAVGMTGEYNRAECLWECEKASKAAGLPSLHIKDASDEELNYYYSQCLYINALRRKEGFELPAAEGLIAGTRPVMFDTSTFRKWFDGLVEFIPEGSLPETIDSLTKLFKGKYRQVTQGEHITALYLFDWRRIVPGFWERCV